MIIPGNTLIRKALPEKFCKQTDVSEKLDYKKVSIESPQLKLLYNQI